MRNELECFSFEELERLLDPKVIDLELRLWAEVHFPECEECRDRMAALKDDDLHFDWPPQGERLKEIEQLKALYRIYLEKKVIPFKKKGLSDE
jgi:hypothetical protein